MVFSSQLALGLPFADSPEEVAIVTVTNINMDLIASVPPSRRKMNNSHIQAAIALIVSASHANSALTSLLCLNNLPDATISKNPRVCFEISIDLIVRRNKQAKLCVTGNLIRPRPLFLFREELSAAIQASAIILGKCYHNDGGVFVPSLTISEEQLLQPACLDPLLFCGPAFMHNQISVDECNVKFFEVSISCSEALKPMVANGTVAREVGKCFVVGCPNDLEEDTLCSRHCMTPSPFHHVMHSSENCGFALIGCPPGTIVISSCVPCVCGAMLLSFDNKPAAACAVCSEKVEEKDGVEPQDHSSYLVALALAHRAPFPQDNVIDDLREFPKACWSDDLRLDLTKDAATISFAALMWGSAMLPEIVPVEGEPAFLLAPGEPLYPGSELWVAAREAMERVIPIFASKDSAPEHDPRVLNNGHIMFKAVVASTGEEGVFPAVLFPTIAKSLANRLRSRLRAALLQVSIGDPALDPSHPSMFAAEARHQRALMTEDRLTSRSSSTLPVAIAKLSSMVGGISSVPHANTLCEMAQQLRRSLISFELLADVVERAPTAACESFALTRISRSQVEKFSKFSETDNELMSLRDQPDVIGRLLENSATSQDLKLMEQRARLGFMKDNRARQKLDVDDGKVDVELGAKIKSDRDTLEKMVVEFEKFAIKLLMNAGDFDLKDLFALHLSSFAAPPAKLAKCTVRSLARWDALCIACPLKTSVKLPAGILLSRRCVVLAPTAVFGSDLLTLLSTRSLTFREDIFVPPPNARNHPLLAHLCNDFTPSAVIDCCTLMVPDAVAAGYADPHPLAGLPDLMRAMSLKPPCNSFLARGNAGQFVPGSLRLLRSRCSTLKINMGGSVGLMMETPPFLYAPAPDSLFAAHYVCSDGSLALSHGLGPVLAPETPIEQDSGGRYIVDMQLLRVLEVGDAISFGTWLTSNIVTDMLDGYRKALRTSIGCTGDECTCPTVPVKACESAGRPPVMCFNIMLCNLLPLHAFAAGTQLKRLLSGKSMKTPMLRAAHVRAAFGALATRGLMQLLPEGELLRRVDMAALAMKLCGGMELDLFSDDSERVVRHANRQCEILSQCTQL